MSDLSISKSELMKKKVKHAGWLSKQGGRISNWKKRYVVIYKDLTFAYFTDQTMEELKGSGSFKQVLHVDVEKFVLKIHTPERIWVFQLENEADRDTWKEQIFPNRQVERMKNLVKVKVDEISKKELMVAKLQSEKELLQAKNQGMEEQNQKLIQRHQGLLENLTFRCATLESKVLDLENRNQTLMSNLSSLASIRASLEQEKVDDLVKYEELRMDRDDLQKQVDLMKKKHLEDELQKDSAANDTEKLKGELEQCKAEIVQKEKAFIATTSAMKSQMEDLQRNLEEQKFNLDHSLNDADSEKAAMATEIQELRQKLEERTINEQRLKARTSALIGDLRPILKDLGISGGNVENENHLRSVMGIMKEQIKNFKARNRDLEGENIRLKNKINYQERNSPLKASVDATHEM